MAGKSKKTNVIETLYLDWVQAGSPSTAIDSDQVLAAIKKYNQGKKGSNRLGEKNPANFLKDLIRKNTILDNWPDLLKQKGVSARQRYGQNRVLQFFTVPTSWPTVFPDSHAPGNNTPIYELQAVSIDSFARNLGRSEEAWLIQVAVNLKIIQTQLALYSPARFQLRDVRHLQMSIKTQPEIDAAYLATYVDKRAGTEKNVLVTLEAKQKSERILTDQIREQVAKAFQITKKLRSPPIDAVKPLALQGIKWKFSAGQHKPSGALFLVEFQEVMRADFEKLDLTEPSEDLWDEVKFPLRELSSTIYRPFPELPALEK